MRNAEDRDWERENLALLIFLDLIGMPGVLEVMVGIRVVISLVAKDLAESISQAGEVLLGSRHAQEFLLT